MSNVVQSYLEKVQRGLIEPDSGQRAVAERLDRLAAELARMKPGLAGFFGSGRRGGKEAPARGLYMYGAVGRGKTMLLDLFFESVRHPRKRRIHFHEFMSDIHERIARMRTRDGGDPILPVARELASEVNLVCLDELQVTDIADAMILSRLFKALFGCGLVVVATSNTAPRRLYWNGLNRALFLPFVDLVEAHMDVLELDAAKDFRLDKLAGRQLYFSPEDAAARRELDAHWERLTGHNTPASVDLEVKGRKVRVPLAAMGVARFHFDDLCRLPLGSLDYLHIAHSFHTVLIEGIPVMTREMRNEARRFVTLIDTLYDNRVSLVASAEAEPSDLYSDGDGSDMFERTASRLMEMRSEAYVERGRMDRETRQTAETTFSEPVGN